MLETQERICLILRNIKLLINQLKLEIDESSVYGQELANELELKLNEIENYTKSQV